MAAIDRIGQSKKRISYYYDERIGNFYFGDQHPMKPHRVRLAHNLVVDYGLYKKMLIYEPYRLHQKDMTMFHSDDYVEFLRDITPENQKFYEYELQVFFRKDEHSDCPVFDGIFDFCQIYSGGSVGGAIKLNQGSSDIVINQSGGLHHAKKSEAAGFCYINDIVLAILELLKHHARVLYIDIDIHHGDGVEEAFYLSDRVMTLSFHKGGDFFPGTGKLEDYGLGKGKYYALNFPLHDGMDDQTYFEIFKPVVNKVVEIFQPSAIVLQCGADSLSGDRLGCFNLSIEGHAKCVAHVRDLNLPLLVLGGGGYTIRNVSRCQAYETSILLETTLPNEIPYNEYYEYYSPDYKLHIEPCDMQNLNTPEYLDQTKVKLFEYLHSLPSAPSVQFHSQPDDFVMPKLEDLGLKNLEENGKEKNECISSEKTQHEAEFYDDGCDVDKNVQIENTHTFNQANLTNNHMNVDIDLNSSSNSNFNNNNINIESTTKENSEFQDTKDS